MIYSVKYVGSDCDVMCLIKYSVMSYSSHPLFLYLELFSFDFFSSRVLLVLFFLNYPVFPSDATKSDKQTNRRVESCRRSAEDHVTFMQNSLTSISICWLLTSGTYFTYLACFCKCSLTLGVILDAQTIMRHIF